MQLILCNFITSFLTLLGKTNDVKTNAGHNSTKHVLTTNLYIYIYIYISIYIYMYIIYYTSCLSEELKDKCITIIQKQIIMKISI